MREAPYMYKNTNKIFLRAFPCTFQIINETQELTRGKVHELNSVFAMKVDTALSISTGILAVRSLCCTFPLLVYISLC